MFSENVQFRLNKIRNEQRAQKVASTLNYGNLILPSSTPSASYSGTVTNTVDTATGVNARWIATFTRSDGIVKTPQVDFPWDYTLDRGYYDDQLASGWVTSATGRDKRAIDELPFKEGMYELGSNYVKWRIDIAGSWFYVATNGTGVHLTAQAVSMVPGTLTLVRVV